MLSKSKLVFAETNIEAETVSKDKFSINIASKQNQHHFSDTQYTI